ncbi:hypothetical protein AAFF_G00306240 [Aldrovandia affinis]|uniref:K Homology domain-containing protein n=1 Tax=Aldrovandia affinis TaxID=143900 RepID=A0AAD7WRJ6_9TELE|nr:hypothetical protein AAFF_G00306240 [Aldrovandia affinis]
MQRGTYNGVFVCAQSIYQKESIIAFYRGFKPSILCMIPYAGVECAVHQSIMSWAKTDSANSSDSRLFFFSFLAFASGQTASYPLAVIRTQQQAQAFSMNPQTSRGGMNDAFKDALQRARQIAAKIGGDVGGAPPPTTNEFGYGGQKRPLEDPDQPETKKVASQMDPFASMMGGMSAPQRSTSEEFKVPDGMVGFIIGRGGEQISRLQQESGCKIQIAPDSGGMPERSVTLTGSPDAIQTAKRLLTEIVEKGRPAPSFHHNDGPGMAVQEILVPATKAGLVIGKGGETIKQLQERAGVKMVMIQEGPQNTGRTSPSGSLGSLLKFSKPKKW